MLNGLYTATSGLLMQQNRVDSISNNLANLNTTSFKKDTSVFTLYRPKDERYPQNYIRESDYNKSINSVVMLDDIVTNFERGQMKQTGNKFDFALENPNAFFVVDTPWGLRYTRDGEFNLNENGELVTQDGYPVLSGALQAPNNTIIDPAVTTDVTKAGVFWTSDLINNVATAPNGNALLVVEFNNEDMKKLQKVGRNEYAAVNATPAQTQNGGVRQGFIEGANVSPITEMVRMIEASRGYEMYSKVVQTHDSIMQMAANKIIG